MLNPQVAVLPAASVAFSVNENCPGAVGVPPMAHAPPLDVSARPGGSRLGGTTLQFTAPDPPETSSATLKGEPTKALPSAEFVSRFRDDTLRVNSRTSTSDGWLASAA